MKKIITLLVIFVIFLSGVNVYAADANVTYSGDAGEFVYICIHYSCSLLGNLNMTFIPIIFKCASLNSSASV